MQYFIFIGLRCLVIGFSICIIYRPAYAEPDSLVKISASQQWLALLHAHPNRILSGFKSEIDSPEFFLSENGKTDPYAELVKSRTDFFLSPVNLQSICRFPARYEFLKAELEMPGSSAEALCPELAAARKARDAQGASIIFAESFLRNPASMFGHTFLRFERKDMKHSRLIDDTVTFAANSEKNRGLALVWNGLTGGYDAQFKSAPYYIRIKQYSDIDRRDLWEFPLKVSTDDLRLLELHLKELRAAKVDYYFLDENCSYHLLSLFRVLRPEEGAFRRSSLYVIPVDTLRALQDVGLLSTEVTYRPSLSTQLQAFSKLLSRQEAGLVKQFATASGDLPDISAFDTSRQVLMLTAADALVRFRKADGYRDVGARLNKLADRRREIPSTGSAPLPTPPALPLSGHDTGRVRARYGRQEYGSSERGFLSLEVRPALHSLLDPPAGYQANSELSFLEPELRWYFEDEIMSLEKFTLFHLRTLPAHNALLSPYSWRIRSRFERIRFPDGSREMVVVPSFAIGKSYDLTPDTRVSFLAAGDIFFASEYAENFDLAPGPVVQLQWGITDRLQLQVQAGTRYSAVEGDRWMTEYEFEQSFRIIRNLSQGLTLRAEREYGKHTEIEALLGLSYYFSGF